MATVLVTGGTGLIGSAVCEQLVAKGDEVRALVRPSTDAGFLDALGVVVVPGDVTSAADVRRAAESCDSCIHCAALVVGGPVHPWEDYEQINVAGSTNVFDAARELGMARVVSFASVPDPRVTDGARYAKDPYFSTKYRVGQEVLRRSRDGQDLVEISPGAVFGAAPAGGRAVTPPGWNSRIIAAIQGAMPIVPSWLSSYVQARDVARSTIAALTIGEPGDRFDLGGRPDDLVQAADFLGWACEAANVDARVRAATPEELESAELAERFGPSMLTRAKMDLETPPTIPPAGTRNRAMDVLGHDPALIHAGVEETVAWMQRLHLV